MFIVFVFLFVATVGGHEVEAQGLREWLRNRIEVQQDAVKKEKERRAKSRSCLYISSGVCRRQIPSAPSHWRSVQRRRYNRERSRSLAECRANCYKRERVILERRSP